VVSLVTNWLVRTFYRNVWQVTCTPTICKRTASTLRESSSTNTTSDALTAWRSASSFQSDCQAVSEPQIPKPMDWSWRCTELATKVTGSEPIRLPCVRLRERYGVCKQGEHERNTAANSQRCKSFVMLQILWSHGTENLSKQMEDTSNNLFECSTANL